MLHELVVYFLQFLLGIQGGELLLAVFFNDLQDDETILVLPVGVILLARRL